LGPVFVAAGEKKRRQVIWPKLAVRGRYGKELTTAESFRRSALVHVDVSARGTDDRLVGTSYRLEAEHVSRCAIPDQKAVVPSPNSFLRAASAAAVYGSPPYEGTWPLFASAMARSTSGRAPALLSLEK
jgi:hypothetical protein